MPAAQLLRRRSAPPAARASCTTVMAPTNARTMRPRCWRMRCACKRPLRAARPRSARVSAPRAAALRRPAAAAHPRARAGRLPHASLLVRRPADVCRRARADPALADCRADRGRFAPWVRPGGVRRIARSRHRLGLHRDGLRAGTFPQARVDAVDISRGCAGGGAHQPRGARPAAPCAAASNRTFSRPWRGAATISS